MSRFHAPEDSITEQSVRQAYAQEYMVPVEVAWGIEQELRHTKQALRALDAGLALLATKPEGAQ